MQYTIYSKPGCGSCEEAKSLMQMHGIEYAEIIIDVGQQKDPSKKYCAASELLSLVPQARSVPQIFLSDGSHLGGLDSLKKRIA